MPKLPERLPKPLDDDARERLLETLPADALPEKRDRVHLLPALHGARIAEALPLNRGS